MLMFLGSDDTVSLVARFVELKVAFFDLMRVVQFLPIQFCRFFFLCVSLVLPLGISPPW